MRIINKALLIPAMLLLATGAVWASKDHDEARRLKEAGAILPLEQVLAKAREAHSGGRVIEAELEHKRGRYIYEIKLVDEQDRVLKLKYDARSGELIKRERER